MANILQKDKIKRKFFLISTLGWINLLLLGLIPFISSLILYINYNTSLGETLINQIKEKGFNIELNPQQLKFFLIPQIFISCLFIISGAGIVKKRAWAQKFTIIFSFLLGILFFLSIILNPSSIRETFFYALYCGVLVLVFTHKSIDEYFLSPNKKA